MKCARSRRRRESMQTVLVKYNVLIMFSENRGLLLLIVLILYVSGPFAEVHGIQNPADDGRNEFNFEEHILVDEQQQSRPRQIRSASNEGPMGMKQIQAKFKEYEDCMKKNDELNNKFYNNFIKVEVAMEKQMVKLSCMICTRPDQDVDTYDIRWFRMLPSSEKLHKVHVNGEKLALTPDKSLIIRTITVEDGGEYVCYRGKAHTAAYMLDVVRGEHYQIVVSPPEKGKRPAEPVELPSHNLNVMTMWSEWSKCSECNKRGQHRRVGFCTVRKLVPSEPVHPEVSWLESLESGLPCRSSLLPDSIKLLREVRKRKSENMVRYCFMACPTVPPVKTYTDATGKVIETVNVGEGYVSMKDGQPTIPDMVKRKMIYEKVNRRIKLECPHDKKGEVAIRWQNGSQTLDALLIKRKTRGRVVITTTQHLAIRRLRYTDTAVYSCWIEGEHIATIKLRVIEKMRRDFKDYILCAGFVAVILILVCIGCGVAKAQRKRALR